MLVTYDGRTETPVYPGVYDVTATVGKPGSTGEATAELRIGLTALVAHGLALSGEIDGALQVLRPESTTLNSGAKISGDLLVSGQPGVTVNGDASYVAVIDGGSSRPNPERTVGTFAPASDRNGVKKFLVFVVTAAVAASLSRAQPNPGEGTSSRSLSLEFGAAGDGRLVDSDDRSFSDIDVRHVGIGVGQRWSLRGPLAVSVDLRYDRFEFQHDPDVVPLPENVTAIGLQATVRKPLNQRWTLLGSVKPSFANSGSLFDGEGAGVSLGALALFRQSESLTWGFGLLYRTPAENFEFVPAIGFDWRPTESWAVTVGFPRSAVTYAVDSRLRLSLAALAHGGTFHVSDRVGGALSSLPPLQDSLLDYTEIRVGLGVDYRPAAALELSAMVGAIVHQEFDYYERDYRLKADDSTAFVTLGARWLF